MMHLFGADMFRNKLASGQNIIRVYDLLRVESIHHNKSNFRVSQDLKVWLGLEGLREMDFLVLR